MLILRVVRALQYNIYIKNILKLMKRTFCQFFSLFILLQLLLIVYTIIGLQIFKKKIFKGNIERNFSTFQSSFISLFEILLLNEWFNFLKQVFQEFGILISVFIISLIITGNFILLNLFIAIMLHGIENESKNLNENDDINNNIPPSKNTFFILSSNFSTEEDPKKSKFQNLISIENLIKSKRHTNDKFIGEKCSLNMNSNKCTSIVYPSLSFLDIRPKYIKSKFGQNQKISSSFLLGLNSIRKKIKKVIKNYKYRKVIIITIIMNSLQLSLSTFDSTKTRPLIIFLNLSTNAVFL